MQARKASLSLSTNAIVMLILSVIIIGLMISMVTIGFDNAERKINKLASEVRDAPRATAANPVSVSVPARISPGDSFVIKVEVFNTDEVEREINLGEINCGLDINTNPYVETTFVNPKLISSSSTASFIVLGEASQEFPTGTRLCSIKVEAGAGTSPSIIQDKTASFSLVAQ